MWRKAISPRFPQKFCVLWLTILFDGNMQVPHKHFCQRDTTDERHPALISSSGDLYDFDTFYKGALPLRDFCVGEKITIDTTDFARVDYDQIDDDILNFIGGKT